MRIIIVDQDVTIGKLLAEGVRLQGHQAIVISSTKTALFLLQQRPFDAVFLDIVMTKGADFLRRLRKTHPAMPVIVITGESTSPEVNEARRLGVIDVIAKPFALANLNQALASLEAQRA
jgi:DNA-binding NtrC family response regulator